MTLSGRHGIAFGVAALLLSACDPAAVPRNPRAAWVDLVLGPRGDAELTVMVAPEKVRLLEELARELEAMAFPSRNARGRIDENGPGYPFLVIRAKEAYKPGTSPSLTVRTAALSDALVGHGITRTEFTLCGPHVPVRFHATPRGSMSNGCMRWAAGQSGSVVATVELIPDPWRWWKALGLLVVALAGTILAWIRSRPTRRGAIIWWRFVAVGVAVAASLFGVISGAGAEGDNLGVAGILDGAALAIATWAPILLLPTLLASLAAAGRLLSRATTEY